MPSGPIENVIANGYCIGCGACSILSPETHRVTLNAAGHYEARQSAPDADPAHRDALDRVCPMSGAGPDETWIARTLYPDLEIDDRIGAHRMTYAGHVSEGEFRDRGSSGGLISWLAAELLARGMVDAVAHVRPVASGRDDGILFEYGLSRTPEEVRGGAKSRYYPITLTADLFASGERLLVIGLPCFIKAVRLLQHQGALSEAQVPFTIGLVCGHLKSRYFAEYLYRQLGVDPGAAETVDFRHKLPGRTASRYGFAVVPRDADGAPIAAPMSALDGHDWGEGQFKNPACEFCDDVLAECSDIAVGDAWLPGYVADHRGANIVVARQKTITALVEQAVKDGRLALDKVSPDAVAKSQASGLRHRREGLAHRLKRIRDRGGWIPAKRVEPKLAPRPERRLVYDLRLAIARRSSAVYAEVRAKGGSLDAYRRKLRWQRRALRLLTRVPPLIVARLKRLRGG